MHADSVVGCLLAIDRLGADDFSDADARVLESMAHELTLRLDAYRLFAQVNEERQRFRRIYYGSKEGICLLDERGVIRAWNPALEKITGYPEAEVIDTSWWERLTIRDENQRRLTGTQLVEVDPGTELEIVTREGPPRWISVLSGALHAGSDESGGWVVLVRDITTEHAAEEAKSDFLATISHELRTPLTTIKGALQMLNRPGDDLPADIQHQMIGLLNRGTDRLERLLMNLLFVSQVETGGVSMLPEELSLDSLVRQRVETMLGGRDDVTFEVEEPGLIVRADRERLDHVVEHLLENAIKHGGPGPITVRVGRTNGYARISVSDTGPGIPRADQDRVFERFSRLGNVLTRESQGAGVGLFIVRRSIEAMGGRVTIESEARKGATFHVTIPMAHPVAVANTLGA
jgi:PAS domain S-box-containing protein